MPETGRSTTILPARHQGALPTGRLLIPDAPDAAAVFNVVGEVPAQRVETVLRDCYAGKLGDADLEERLLRNVDEGRFREICQTALEGLASKKLNLDMLVERRARAQERRIVPETTARFLKDAASQADFALKPTRRWPQTFQPGRTPRAVMEFERDPDWRLGGVSGRYPRLSTARKVSARHNLEWVTRPVIPSSRRCAAMPWKPRAVRSQ